MIYFDPTTVTVINSGDKMEALSREIENRLEWLSNHDFDDEYYIEVEEDSHYFQKWHNALTQLNGDLSNVYSVTVTEYDEFGHWWDTIFIQCADSLFQRQFDASNGECCPVCGEHYNHEGICWEWDDGYRLGKYKYVDKNGLREFVDAVKINGFNTINILKEV